MPSKSGKQHRLMALVANDPKAAKRLGIPQSVGEKFMKADKGRKFNSGGPAKERKDKDRDELTEAEENELKVAEFLNQPDYETGGPKRRYRAGKVKRYEDEGQPHSPGAKVVEKRRSGGSVSSASRRADGIAAKGKTRCKIV
jgi:hypothetical protein